MTAPLAGPLREVVIDLAAIRENVAALTGYAGDAQVMAVVKADAYGHGLVPSARAARAGGASWLGTALLEEALALRAAGLDGRILSWLMAPGEPGLRQAVGHEIDLSVGAPWALADVSAAARAAGRAARVHLKIDTGLSRGGAPAAAWLELVAAALHAQAEGVISVVGIWSHLAWADAPGHPTIDLQRDAFVAAVEQAQAVGVRPEVVHLANSAATLTRPDLRFDLVRPGLAVFGLSPVPEQGGPAAFGLRPAMSLRARLALVKRIPAGSGVSYGHEWVAPRETSVGLVPLGYADGVPRAAGSTGPVLVGGRRRAVTGRVCMDQFVIDLGDDDVHAGDEVVLFGAGPDEPSAEEWAQAAGTISYEIIARVGARVAHRWVGA